MFLRKPTKAPKVAGIRPDTAASPKAQVEASFKSNLEKHHGQKQK